MFGSTESQKKNFIEKKKVAREERALEKRREEAAVTIQAHIRGYIQFKRYQRHIISDLDELIGFNSANTSPKDTDIQLNTSTFAYPIIRRYIGQYEFIKNYDASLERFEQLCRYLNKAMEVDVPKLSYVLLCLQKDKSLSWIAHIKSFLFIILRKVDELKPENHTNSTSLAVYLHTLVVFTSTKSWAILRNKKLGNVQPAMQRICSNILGYLLQNNFYEVMRHILLKGSPREELTLKPLSLMAIITLCMRPLIDGNFPRDIFVKFLIEILSVPALVYHLKKYVPQCLEIFTNIDLFKRILTLTDKENWLNDVGTYMPATKCLALLGNIINLFAIETPTNVVAVAYPMFTNTVYQLFELIPNTVSVKGVFSQWHEMLGWHTPSKDSAQNQNVALIKKQFNMLWTSRSLMMLFGDKLQEINANYEHASFQPPVQASTSSILRKALERSTTRNTLHKSSLKTTYRKFNSNEVQHISRVCAMYYSGLNSLSQLKMEILTGVCYTGNILYDLWLFITSLGPYCGLKEFLELFKMSDYHHAAPTSMLMLFCDCMTHYVTILDEHEMYTEQKPFQLSDYVLLTYFLNNILYKIVTDVVIADNSKNISQSQLFVSLHTLLLCLYRRDSRRKFTSSDHWIISEVKPNTFLNDLDKGKRYALILLQKMPHIIPHEDRVKLFRKFVQNEKVALGVTESVFATPRSSLIIVHRDRLVEDGYRQLAALKPQELKGVVRVRFVNQQGLHEAGIDQDGVFKEFLEETIKKVFDPALNLFKTTSDQRLYPSPISYVQDNHLQLFDFIGRMLGKAVYEGIVVDVPFATFFLSQLLGQSQQALYSCIDELSSLDVELYRNLTFIKHYKEDVAALNLTFSVDQDVMGKIVTHELQPGGKSREVNNFNKLVYVHYMAYFHMNSQIRDQTQAFNRGFRSIVNPEWLSLFSSPELQRLISGDTAPLDFKDLRKNTQYYGGFHDSHRVICWLWEILAKDFTEDEKRLFLKFVTSCSKPPLLGFAHLEPPFSIRCVEVGDDEDTGDTIGSVIRGFFTIHKRDPLNRLPTSSTCFNLLKLPNYQKKSTLRDKLRYAITSNTGFELS